AEGRSSLEAGSGYVNISARPVQPRLTRSNFVCGLFAAKRLTTGSQLYQETLDERRQRASYELSQRDDTPCTGGTECAYDRHDGRTREKPYTAQRQRRSTVRTEFHCLCAAARCRVSLFRGPKVLSSRRALLCACIGNRRGRKKRSRARP